MRLFSICFQIGIRSLHPLSFLLHRISYMTHDSTNPSCLLSRLWLVGVLFQFISNDSIPLSTGNADLVLRLLSTCHNRWEVETVLACQSNVTSRDVFLAGLQACSSEQGQFFDSYLFYLVHQIDFTLHQVELNRSIRCVLELMPLSQRSAFYWLITLLEHTKSLLSVCAETLSEGSDVELMETFLIFCVDHKAFLFMPTIPSCSMNLSFEELHLQESTRYSRIDLDSFYNIPDTYTETTVITDKTSVWNSPWNRVT